MPIYDYVCSSCATRTEVIHGINAAAPKFCPSCGAEGTLKKVFVAPVVHFKGSGWAKKDRSSSSGTRTKASGASDGAGESKSSNSEASTTSTTSNDSTASSGSSSSSSGPASADA